MCDRPWETMTDADFEAMLAQSVPDTPPEEIVAEQVRKACESCGKLYFIPNASQGLPMSTYPGVYEALSREIDNMSKEMF